MKKILTFVVLVALCFGFVGVVNAASKDKDETLNYNDSTTIEKADTWSTYYTRFLTKGLTNSPTVKTTTQRKLLGIWGLPSSVTQTVSNVSYVYTVQWSGMNFLDTRATWLNTKSSSQIAANFRLQDQ